MPVPGTSLGAASLVGYNKRFGLRMGHLSHGIFISICAPGLG